MLRIRLVKSRGCPIERNIVHFSLGSENHDAQHLIEVGVIAEQATVSAHTYDRQSPLCCISARSH